MRKIVQKEKLNSKHLFEEIHAFTFDPTELKVSVAVGYGFFDKEKRKFIFDLQYGLDTYYIEDEDFKNLMRKNGGADNLVPGKPSGTFRKDDLWVFIDKEKEKRKHLFKQEMGEIK